MILREELEELMGKELSDYLFDTFPEESIARMNKQKVREILKVLNRENLKEMILANGGTLLPKGNATRVEGALQVLDENKDKLGRDILERSGSVLTGNNQETMNELIDLFSTDKRLSIDMLRTNPSILARGNPENILAILDVLGEKKVGLTVIRRCGDILVNGNPTNISEVIDTIDDEYGLDRSIFETNAAILVKGSRPRIKGVLKALDDTKIGRQVLETNGDILVKSDGDKITGVSQILDIDFIKDHPIVLTASSVQNVSDMCRILKEHGLDHITKKSAKVLTVSPKGAEKTITLFEGNLLRKQLESSPSLLSAYGYNFLLSRINYLKSNSIPLTVEDEEVEKLNPDITISSEKFKKKYGISNKQLQSEYGEMKSRKKTDIDR